MKILLSALVLSAAALNAGGQTSHCVDIEDPSERLACFDAQFRGQPVPEEPGVEEPVVEESAPDAPEPVAETDRRADPEPAPKPAESAAPEPPAAAVAVTPAAETTLPAPEPAPVTPESDTTWLGDEKVNLSSTIRAIRAGEKQKMVFLLDNEQVWMQASPRSLPFEAGDRITIKNALLGGYYMHSENGASTRVQRIQ